jgi:hypothetical protein
VVRANHQPLGGMLTVQGTLIMKDLVIRVRKMNCPRPSSSTLSRKWARCGRSTRSQCSIREVSVYDYSEELGLRLIRNDGSASRVFHAVLSAESIELRRQNDECPTRRPLTSQGRLWILQNGKRR